MLNWDSFTSGVVLLILIGFSLFYLYYWNRKEKKLPKEQQASTELKDQKNSDTDNYTDSESDTEIQAEEYSESSMDLVRPNPFHGFVFRSIPINGEFWVCIVAKVYHIGVIDQDSKRLIVWARIHFYCFSPMPAPRLIKCKLSRELHNQPISIGNFVLVKYNAFEKDTRKRRYYIIKINYLYH